MTTNDEIIKKHFKTEWEASLFDSESIISVKKKLLDEMLNEARADERANTELLKKVLLELIDAIAHYLSDDPDYNISTLTKAIINGQKALTYCEAQGSGAKKAKL